MFFLWALSMMGIKSFTVSSIFNPCSIYNFGFFFFNFLSAISLFYLNNLSWLFPINFQRIISFCLIYPSVFLFSSSSYFFPFHVFWDIFSLNFFFSTVPHYMWTLISQTRNQTCTPCIGNIRVFTTGPPGKPF